MTINRTVTHSSFQQELLKKMAHQVLLQLFVVGNDAIVNNNKLWKKGSKREKISESKQLL